MTIKSYIIIIKLIIIYLNNFFEKIHIKIFILFKSIILIFPKNNNNSIKEELNIKISSYDFSALFRVILKNKQMTINLLKDLTQLDIQHIEFEDFKKMDVSSGYDFSIIKLKAILGNGNKNLSDSVKNEKEIYIKTIRKDRIKESIFCYWSLLYDEKFKDFEESEFTSVINKVKITEIENQDYKHTVLLEINDNKWEVLKNGSTIQLVKFVKFLNSNTIKKSELTNEWKEFIDGENQDVLFIGIIN